MLKRFFDISTGFRFSKISVECSVHLCSCPCPIVPAGANKAYSFCIRLRPLPGVRLLQLWTFISNNLSDPLSGTLHTVFRISARMFSLSLALLDRFVCLGLAPLFGTIHKYVSYARKIYLGFLWSTNSLIQTVLYIVCPVFPREFSLFGFTWQTNLQGNPRGTNLTTYLTKPLPDPLCAEYL